MARKLKKEIVEKIALQDPRNRKIGKGKTKLVKRQHVDNLELQAELIKFIEVGIATERLGEIFINLVDNYATKSNFSGYSYLEEMKSRAIFFLLKYSKSFNPKKSNNAFAYCTQIVKNAFIQVIKKENKHAESHKKFKENFLREHDFSKKENEVIK